MSTRHQAVTDVVCPANQDHKAHQERMVNLESLELPARQETPESHQQPHVNLPLHPHASLVHKGHRDLPVHQEAQATQERLAPQDDQELMPHPEVLDQEDHLDHPESPDQLAPMENQESPPNPNHWFQANQENPETKDPPDHPARQELQEMMDHPDPLEAKENQAPMEPQDKMDKLDQLDPPEEQAQQERRVSARNTAPWTVESSSRTVRVVKLKFNKILYDSQASFLPLQRNAVFFLLIQFPIILRIIFGNLEKERWKFPNFP